MCQNEAEYLIGMLITVPGAKVPGEVPLCTVVTRQLMLRLAVMDPLICWHVHLPLRTPLQEALSEEPIRTGSKLWMI